ncbi:MAG: hypothetical protein HY269_09430 [Deltaproteobacteria bacterium]|nr:hypothetical protein [Deltaproteobacteria bacterium]
MFRALAALALAACASIGPAPPSAAETKPMTFGVRTGLFCGHLPCHWIVAEGTITADTPRAFSEFIEANGFDSADSTIAVVISSPGGDLLGAVRMGKLIRTRNFKTYVGTTVCEDGEWRCELAAGECHGACVYMLAGGIRRKVHESSAFSVQRFSREEVRDFLARERGGASPTDVSRPGAGERRLNAVLSRYLESMTVSPQLLAVVASAPKDGQLRLGPGHLRALNVSTHVIHVPTQWRLSGQGAGMRLVATNGVFETGGSERVSYSVTLSCSETHRGRILVHFAETGSRITREFKVEFLRAFATHARYVGLGDDSGMSEPVERRFGELKKSGNTLGFSLYFTQEEVLPIARAKELRIGIGMPYYLDGGIGAGFALDDARDLLVSLLRACAPAEGRPNRVKEKGRSG